MKTLKKWNRALYGTKRKKRVGGSFGNKIIQITSWSTGPLARPVTFFVRRKIMVKSFNKVKNDLAPDGALRDFYIKDITQSDWNRFLAFVTENMNRFTFQWGDREVPIPKSFHEIKTMQDENPTTLTIWIGDQTICCHFFIDSKIEIDFRPNDVDNDQKWNDLVAFFQSLVSILGKKGIITQENWEDYIIDEIIP